MSKFAMCIYSRMDTEGGPGFVRLLPMYKYGSGATQFISWGYFYYCCYCSFGGWCFKLYFEMLTMYLRYCSEYSTVPVLLLISWFQSSGSQIFLIMGYFVSGLVLVDHCPQEPSTTLIFHCCSSALLSPSLVPAPSCKPPWSLFLTLLVIFRPRSLWLAAVGYSKWSGGPSISTACGDFAMGLDGWGRTAGAWVAQCWRVKRVGWGWRILSVDHHLGPGGLWWSTGSIWEPLISWKNRMYQT